MSALNHNTVTNADIVAILVPTSASPECQSLLMLREPDAQGNVQTIACGLPIREAAAYYADESGNPMPYLAGSVMALNLRLQDIVMPDVASAPVALESYKAIIHWADSYGGMHPLPTNNTRSEVNAIKMLTAGAQRGAMRHAPSARATYSA
jgi:hypothetical protein